jgi:NADH dehydrogenase (ubiquinone) 1 alpha subcomplex subunit 9
MLSRQIAQSLKSSQVLSRNVHDSYLPAGAGGRSSWSGVAACVFGCTGSVGKSVANRMGRNGMAAVLPNRGNDFDSADFGPMFDLGQYIIRDGFDIKRNSDEELMSMIANTNVVINLVGAQKPWNQYTMKDVNYDWAIRIAKLVAAKNDGTKLINLHYLNSADEEARKESVILQQQWDAEQAIREIYPEAIQIRSSFAYGHLDKNYLDLLRNKRWQNFSTAGAWPILLNGGRHTFHRPLSVGDLSEAIVRIAKHPDSPGHTFELYGSERLQLNEIVKNLYEVCNEEAFLFDGIKTTFDSETKTRTNTPDGILEKLKMQFLHTHLSYYTMPRPWTSHRFFDMWSRTENNKTNSYQWITKSMYYQLNQSCQIQNRNNPGLEELGIIPEKMSTGLYGVIGVFERNHYQYQVNNSKAWQHQMQSYPDDHEIRPRLPEADIVYNQKERDLDLDAYTWERENMIRDHFVDYLQKPERLNEDRQLTSRKDSEQPNQPRKVDYSVIRGLPRALN